MPFTIVTRKAKYTERNLPKRVKGLYDGNYKSLVKGIEKETQTQNWKDLPHSWAVGKEEYCQNIHPPNMICSFSSIPIKIPMACFTELEKHSKISTEAQKMENWLRQS